MIAPARVAAYDILCTVSAGRADLPSAIAYARAALADDRDRALAAEIAAGVQRWRAALDHLIVRFSKRELDRLDPEVVEILRLSAYQLVHLTRVPAAAVVDDAVNLAGRAGKRSASGFVNAVLRNVSRSRTSLPLPPRPENQTSDREAAIEYFSISLSHPRWLAARWYDRLGFDAAETWMKFNNTAAPLTLRRRTACAARPVESLRIDSRLATFDVTVRPGAFAPGALIVESGYPLRESAGDGGIRRFRRAGRSLAACRPARGRAPRPPCARHLRVARRQGHGHRRVARRGGPARRLRRPRPPHRSAPPDRFAPSGAVNIRVVQADLLAPLPV